MNTTLFTELDYLLAWQKSCLENMTMLEVLKELVKTDHHTDNELKNTKFESLKKHIIDIENLTIEDVQNMFITQLGTSLYIKAIFKKLNIQALLTLVGKNQIYEMIASHPDLTGKFKRFEIETPNIAYNVFNHETKRTENRCIQSQKQTVVAGSEIDAFIEDELNTRYLSEENYLIFESIKLQTFIILTTDLDPIKLKATTADNVVKAILKLMINNTLLTEKLKSFDAMKSCVDCKPNDIFYQSEIYQDNIYKLKDFEACLENKCHEFKKHNKPQMVKHAKGLLNTLSLFHKSSEQEHSWISADPDSLKSDGLEEAGTHELK